MSGENNIWCLSVDDEKIEREELESNIGKDIDTNAKILPDSIAKHICEELRNKGLRRVSAGVAVLMPWVKREGGEKQAEENGQSTKDADTAILMPFGYHYSSTNQNMNGSYIREEINEEELKKIWWWRWRWYDEDKLEGVADEWKNWWCKGGTPKRYYFVDDWYGIVNKLVTIDEIQYLVHGFQVDSIDDGSSIINFETFKAGSGNPDIETPAFIEMALLSHKMINFAIFYIPIFYKILRVGYVFVIVDLYDPLCRNKEDFEKILNLVKCIQDDKVVQSAVMLARWKYIRCAFNYRDAKKIIQALVAPKDPELLTRISYDFLPLEWDTVEVKLNDSTEGIEIPRSKFFRPKNNKGSTSKN